MKRFFFLATILLLAFRANAQEVHSSFLPDSPYYAGNNLPNPEFQIECVYWNWWDVVTTTTGHEIDYFIQQRSDYTYLPNGKVSPIAVFELDKDNEWKPSKRYYFEYDENGRVSSFREEEKSYYDSTFIYQWQYNYTYDENDHLVYTFWDAFVYGQEDHTQYEFKYAYNDEGQLIDKTIRLINLNHNFRRWLYTYENGLLSTECMQYGNEWYNWSLETYYYEEGKLASSLYQLYDYNSSSWYDHGRTVYEYDATGTVTTITQQLFGTDWTDYSRETQTRLTDGTMVQDSFEIVQNGEWIPEKTCDYTIDNNGNCIDAHWHEYVWVHPPENYQTHVFFNHGQSYLSSELIDISVSYKSHISTDEIADVPLVTLYPNPGKNTLSIQADGSVSNVVFFDQLGRRVFEQKTPLNTRIDTSNWHAGIYTWKAYSKDNGIQCGKWVKE